MTKYAVDIYSMDEQHIQIVKKLRFKKNVWIIFDNNNDTISKCVKLDNQFEIQLSKLVKVYLLPYFNPDTEIYIQQFKLIRISRCLCNIIFRDMGIGHINLQHQKCLSYLL